MRGPGELWGTRQAGLPELKLADLARDEAQLLEARDAGRAVVAADPQLQATEHLALRSVLRERFEDALALALAG
jgi:ATP-dependent DNA helicase RecG